MQPQALRPSIWLAERLGLSISTIERLRAAGSSDLPPSIVIGTSIRYDQAVVEQWLLDRIASQTSKRKGGHDDLAA